MKPVELVERAIQNSSRKGNAVLDPFAGSGSTVIACENVGRLARMIEIDPAYADVIIKRWQNYTRQSAVLEQDGHTFDQVASERLSQPASEGGAE
jgi:DNA modification methylase